MKQKNPIEGDAWETNLEKAVDLIQNHETFLFAADLDPDSVGSMLSLALYLRLLGKKSYIVMAEKLGQGCDYIDKIITYNNFKVLYNEATIHEIKQEIDAVVFFDSANTKLVPFYHTINKEILTHDFPVVEIDHHFGADSEEMTHHGIKLFRNANANTEIVAELLFWLHEKNPDFPNPFSQRNILLALITGLLGDTLGGKVVPIKEDYKYWIDMLGESLNSVTRFRQGKEERPCDTKEEKFSNPEMVLTRMNRMDADKQACLDKLTQTVRVGKGMGILNLLDSTYDQVKDFCQPYDSEWFNEIRDALLNTIPEMSKKIGIVYFDGKNAENHDCIFIKMRRSIGYSGYDLRDVINEVTKIFPKDHYMGGGGHPGAISIRIHPMTDATFHAKLSLILDYLATKIA